MVLHTMVKRYPDKFGVGRKTLAISANYSASNT
jgi:hypothetical protein